MITSFMQTVIFLGAVCVLGLLVNLAIYRIFGDAARTFSFSNLPLFFVLGAGTYTYYEMFLSILGIKSHIGHFGILLFAFSGINFVFYLRDKSLTPTFSRSNKTKISSVIISFIIIGLSLNLIMTMSFPQFDIDMVAHILMKAKLFTTDTYQSSSFLHDKVFANIQSRYPPFAGMFYNLMFLFGGKTVSCYQIVNYFIFLMLGLSIYSYLKLRISVWQSLLWFFIFISTKSYISSQFIMDSTDVMLSLSFLLAVFWLLEFYHTKSLYSFSAFSVIAGISTLIKNEALFFNLIALSVIIWLAAKLLWRHLLIFSVIAGPWILYRFTLPNPLTGPARLIATANILESLKYLPLALSIAGNILTKKWNVLLLLWIPATVLLRKSPYKKECLIFSIFCTVFLLVYFVIFWLFIGRTPNYSNIFLRIICHVYPMALICVALAVAELLKK